MYEKSAREAFVSKQNYSRMWYDRICRLGYAFHQMVWC
ncbi:unnamed protein product [Callosobruchus maculatus]|uniref:Uncharacterized protein n=1 Tax=Callosobruchus maculatus TaxID=64391 RepID=A0A653DE65_CALMS|nr:unnamed protein product [Callosobruchus maculatus]